MTTTILVLQHTTAEGLGRIAHALRAHHVAANFVTPDMPLPPGALERSDGIVLLGGPMGVYDTDSFPRLHDEVRLLEQALARETPILGICLGSQLLATALGARVHRGPAMELGWHEVALEPGEHALFRDLPRRFRPLHWHGDVFELPPGAVHVARSAFTDVQCFSYAGTAWGLLFHLEAGVSEVRTMASAFHDEVVAAGDNPEALIASSELHAGSAARIGDVAFGRWVDLVLRAHAGAGRG